MTPRSRHNPRAFTLVELLVVIAVIAVLIGLTIPALASARESARSVRCGTNLHELGVAITMHLGDHDGALPQLRVDQAGAIQRAPAGENIGALFGGKKGLLPVYGLDSIGADRRPLNAYLGDYGPDDEAEVFSDPSDEGTSDPFLSFFPDLPKHATMYDLVGTSYNLNDHALDDDPYAEIYPTLVPDEGGKAPDIVNPSRTWVCADQPIFNFDDGGDRGQRWHFGSVAASLHFADSHVRMSAPVPATLDHTTPDYTFLPDPDWLERLAPAPPSP